MHPSALKLGALFFDTYVKARSDLTIVDIGSQDINGSLHDLTPKNCNYIGVDFAGGKNVDIVLDDPYKLPFEENSIDVVVCSSVFEHSQYFWVLFLEIIRILKPEGLLYLNAPSNGYIHKYPVDCWRFYPDSGLALASWAKLNGYKTGLLESFIGDRNFNVESNETWWNDYCAVFIKDTGFSYLYKNRLLNSIAHYSNAQCDDSAIDSKQEFFTDDFLLIKKISADLQNLSSLLSVSNNEVERIAQIATNRDQELDLLNKKLVESDQLYLIELNRLDNDAKENHQRLIENEKIANERMRTVQLAHDSQLTELQSTYTADHQVNQNALAKVHKEIEYLQLEATTNKNLNAVETSKLRADYEQQKSELIKHEKIQYENAQKKIEDYVLKILNLENNLSQQRQDFQLAAIAQVEEHSRRMQALSETFSAKFEAFANSNTQQLTLLRADFSTRERNLWEHVEAERTSSRTKESIWLEKEENYIFNNDDLKQKLQAIYSSVFWKLTIPFRWFKNRSNQTSYKTRNDISHLPIVESALGTPTSTLSCDQLNNPPQPIECPAIMTSNIAPRIHGDSTTSLNEMLSYQNEGFVQNAYHVLLARAADPEGLQHYLTRLQRGVSKVEILVEISLSREGRKLNVEIPSLKKEIKRYRLLRYPVLGHVFKACGLTLTDAKVENNVRVIENKLIYLEATMSQQMSQLMQALIAGNHKSSNLSNTNRLVIKPQVNQQPPVLRTPQQVVKVAASTPPAQTSAQAPSNIASIKVLGRGSTSHLALSKNLDSAIPNDRGILKDETKLIAFYLPQFHQTKENSEWWGPGFTEWTNAANGKPNFKGHYQPHIPRELGFYDLQNVEVMRAQADLAKTYGVYGFCYYYYWFSGRRILERPLDNFLASNIDMPFCLCWANENWTRTWDGDEKSVLLEQGYAAGDEEKFISDILPFLKDSRCIKVGDKPLLLVYRIKQLPDPINSIKKWRAAALQAGLPGLHVSVVDFYDISDPREVGADALVEFPPHKFNGPNNHPNPMPEFTNPSFAGGMIDYKKVIAQSKSRQQPDFTLYRGIIPGWDNTARRQHTPMTIIHNTPELYGEWLSHLRGYSRAAHLNNSSSMIFVNAWNEWGEGCHLEPDLHWGLSFLEETLRSSWYDTAE